MVIIDSDSAALMAAIGEPLGNAFIVDARCNAPLAAFADLDDAAFAAACVDAPTRLVARLQAGLATAPDRIVIVLNADQSGGWHMAHRAAAAAIAIGLARSLALEFGAAGLLVNCVAAGRGAGDAALAAAITYLLSPGASGVAGQLLVVDGGDGLRMRHARRR